MSRRALALMAAAATALGTLAVTAPATARPAVSNTTKPHVENTTTASLIPSGEESPDPGTRLASVRSWVYQLQRYPRGRLDKLAASSADLVVIDLARDASTKWFSSQEIKTLRDSGKIVLAYFEVGSIEDFRPELAELEESASDLLANRWDEWPDERFVRFWDERWWDIVIRGRLDRALQAGFDGVYLDTLLAYEEIALKQAEGRSRSDLANEMVALLRRIRDYTSERRPGFLVVPQNSPELRTRPGYLEAMDGIGMEELFFQATDRPCVASYCGENLQDARALRAAGKAVLTVDYAQSKQSVDAACRRADELGFVPYVARVELDRIGVICSQE